MPIEFNDLFRQPKPVIAMIHTGPSPGVPGYMSVDSAVDRAIAEADEYLQAGVDGIMIENMRDLPCIHEREMGPEISAFMTRVARAVKRRARDLPVGIQVLFQANRTALAVALASGCDFIRAEGWIYAHVSDKGIAESCAGDIVRYRESIGATHIPVFADVKKKHAAHVWTDDVPIGQTASLMALHRADAVVVTGDATGSLPSPDDLAEVRKSTALPVLIGSGVTAESIGELALLSDGFIVGSSLKENGLWNAPVSEVRVEAVINAVRAARGVAAAASEPMIG